MMIFYMKKKNVKIKWQYRVLLIQLLRVLLYKNYKFVHPVGLKNIQNLVKSHSLTSKWITITIKF